EEGSGEVDTEASADVMVDENQNDAEAAADLDVVDEVSADNVDEQAMHDDAIEDDDDMDVNNEASTATGV
ncbi:MAG: hypothetical protein OEZ15_11175, partial [Gammaproteobacteria bacterium]|nr:hypothetical protein [Gammaproteobacteria bacterium]